MPARKASKKGSPYRTRPKRTCRCWIKLRSPRAGMSAFRGTFADALERFKANPVVTGWFPDSFADVYVKHKHGEIAFLADRDEASVCAAYEAVY
jgi:glutamine synthetase